jgi:hypothetical protein
MDKYDEERNRIIEKIRNRECSASMSGIEYFPKPWAELDPNNSSDKFIIDTWTKKDRSHG